MSSPLKEDQPATHSLLLTDLFLPHSGGSRIFYYHLYRGWAPDRVTVLTTKIPGWREFDLRESDEYFRIIRQFSPLLSWKYHQLPKAIVPMLCAAAQVLARRVDVVHSGDLFPPGVLALLLKRAFGIPFVAFCHGEDITAIRSYRFQPRMRNQIFRAADAVIANSEYSRQMLLELGIPAGQIHKITPGVDGGVFYPAERNPELVARYGLQDKFVVLTVARIVARKGHDMVIRAVARLVKEFPQVRYLIAGTGEEEEKLRRLAAELGVSEAVIFSGYVPQEQLPDFYRLGDVMAMPNRSQAGDLDGFGITFLEANAVGRPVIGGRCGGAVEAVADGLSGLLVNPTDCEELTAVLRELLLQPRKREAMGLAGRERACSQFDWKLRAKELRNVTRAIALRRRQRTAPAQR